MNKHWTAEEQKEHRRLWVEALRSGKYEQAKSQLRSGDSFCCLGVACDVSEVGGWQGRRYIVSPSDQSADTLPSAIRNWLGLADDIGGWGNEHDDDAALTTKNDHGSSFTEIADIIESEPAGLLAPAPTAEGQKP